MPHLKVGASKAVITPTEDILPFPTSIGNVQRTAIHDDCHVRAVIIDNGNTRAAIVTFDLCILPPPDTVREIVSHAGSVPPDHILLCATHNHSVPYTTRENPGAVGPVRDPILQAKTECFTKIVYQGAEQAVRNAASSMRDAKYGFSRGESYINVNRDKLFADGYWMQDANYAGYSDKTLSVLKFVDLHDQLIAVVLNYAAHGIFGFLAKDSDGQVKVSSDFIGVTCGFVERRYGNNAVCLWTPAAEGNQNPILSSMLCTYEDDGYAVRRDLPDGSAYLLMESIGGQHALDAISIIDHIGTYSEECPIFSEQTQVLLPSQKPPMGADMAYNRLLTDNLVPLGPNGERPIKHLVTMEDDPAHPYPMPMQLLKLGNVAFVGIPNEIYAEIGRDLKAASPIKNTVIVTHTDSRCIGYIADKSSAHHNVFQSFGPVKPGACDEIILQGMLELFHNNHEKE